MHADGPYPEDSVHGLVQERLARYAERLRDFDADGATNGSTPSDD